jgi:hypothetical protein
MIIALNINYLDWRKARPQADFANHRESTMKREVWLARAPEKCRTVINNDSRNRLSIVTISSYTQTPFRGESSGGGNTIPLT